MDERVTRSQLLMHVAEQTNLPQELVHRIYKAIVDEIILQAMEGKVVCLNGVGTFRIQPHRGHPVHFGDSSFSKIENYSVFKFSTAHSLNVKIRKMQKE